MNPSFDSHQPFWKQWTDREINRMSGTAMTRREAVRRTLLGATGLVLGHHLNLRALAATSGPKPTQRPRPGSAGPAPPIDSSAASW